MMPERIKARLPRRNRLYFRQANWALVLILIFGSAGSAIQIYYDWIGESQRLEVQVNQLLGIVLEPARQAAYALDTELGNSVVSGLTEDDHFYRAELIDELGNTLAVAERPPHQDPYRWLTDTLIQNRQEYRLSLVIRDQLNVGEVIVSLDGSSATSNFLARSTRLFLIGFVRNLLLGFALMSLFYLLTSRPLIRLILQLQELSSKPHSSDTPINSRELRDDELGILTSTINSLWSSRLKAEKELSERETFFRAVLEQSSEAVILFDTKGNILETNLEARRALGYSAEEMRELNVINVNALDSPEVLIDRSKNLQFDEPNSVHTIYRRKDGSTYPVELRSKLVTLSGETRILASIRDISERKRAEERLNELAFFDELTGLPNRRLLQNRLDLAIKSAERHNHIGAILFMDLDRFKTVNDSLGHNTGDELLREFARNLQQCLREEDTAARLGGDEFVVMVPEISSQIDTAQQQTQLLINRIQDRFSQPISVNGMDLFLSLSIGVSLFPVDGDEGTSLLQQADTAMYRAKEEAASAHYFYQPAMQQKANERLKLEKALHKAVENDELTLHYQPQINSKSEIFGLETLVRWNHPELGPVSPAHFIPIAEETGLILKIGRWVTETACKQLADWQAMGLPPSFRRLSINISPRQFADQNFVSEMDGFLNNTGANGHLLELELTENLLISNTHIIVEKIKSLRKLGFSFSIDDFGTGYSSLRYLKELPLDRLKIDQSFVRDLCTDSNSQSLVHTIVAMADHLELDVIAEGVETGTELEILLRLGCRKFQGFYFSKPMDARYIEQHFLQKKITESEPG